MKARASAVALCALVIALVIAPLVACSIWMYQASAGAFQLQHNVRQAQTARGRVVRLFFATESDVYGFAASRSPSFVELYNARQRQFDSAIAALERDLDRLGVSHAREFTMAEHAIFRHWITNIAGPVFVEGRAGRAYPEKSFDPAYSEQMLYNDQQLGIILDDMVSVSETNRQLLLRRILLASILLVALSAAVIAALLHAREAAERSRLRQGVLYDEERRVTKMLQLALTPGSLPVVPGLALHAAYVPAASERQIGGDWYEALELRNGSTLLMIGDVAGHGLEAAVIVNRVRQGIVGAAITESDPARLLAKANRALYARDSGMVTAACCIFDPHTMLLTYASAGHPAPLVLRPNGEAYFLRYGGAPLGILDDLVLETQSYQLEPNSTLVLYTDGLIEEQRDVVAGEQRILDAIHKHHGAHDPADALFREILGKSHPRDDVAILTMRVAHAPVPRIRAITHDMSYDSA